MKTWAVVPVKRFDAAKSRLAGVLDRAARARLARELFEHVFGVVSSCPAVAGVAVVTDSEEVLALASARGALAIRDPEGSTSLADVVDAGVEAVGRIGAGGALVLMSDLPLLTLADVDGLVRDLEGSEVVVVGDRRGDHTNALGLRLGSGQCTFFGTPDSFRRHCDAARRSGLSLEVKPNPRIAFDVDLPEDLGEAQDLAGG